MTNVCQKAEKNHDFKMASLPEGDGGKKIIIRLKNSTEVQYLYCV